MQLCRLHIPRSISTRALLRAIVVASIVLALLTGAGAVPASVTAAPSGATASHAHASASKAKQSIKGSSFEGQSLDLSTSTKKATSGSGSGAILRMLIGLAIVVGLIFGVHRLLRKLGKDRIAGISGDQNGVIEVLSTTPLAQGRNLHLVRVGDELVLIGATETSISRIGTVDADKLSVAAGNAGNSGFQQTLSRAMTTGGSVSTPTTTPNQTFAQRFIANLQLMTSR